MPTTIVVHVEGRKRAIVKQGDLEPVTVEGTYAGGYGERMFHLSDPQQTFVITEEDVPENEALPPAD